TSTAANLLRRKEAAHVGRFIETHLIPRNNAIRAATHPGPARPGAVRRPQLGGALLSVVVLVLMATCPFLCFVWHAAGTLARFFPKINITTIRRKIYTYFMRLAIFFFVRAPGLKVHLYGDAKEVFQRDESVLYMSNHQSSVDWLVACILAMKAKCLDRIKFIMKQELHWVPIVGYYISVIGHIYVRRRGFRPDRLIESVNCYTKAQTPIWVGIFPEGTRFNPEDRKAITYSEEMAKSSKLPPLKHQLTPRPKGSWLLLDNMRSHLSAVYSVTLVYEQAEPRGQRARPPSAADVIRGQCSNVHVHVKRIPIEDVPKEEAQFLPWLHNESLERDKRMSEYYSTRSFASWGPALEDDEDSTAHIPDLSWVVLMGLGLLLAPLVRKMYILTALASTLCGYVSLEMQPPF
ncbi:1-acyl-sn-glycerol-3-phosphate acyltransferase epsilon, partial [Frankliniella fusca]